DQHLTHLGLIDHHAVRIGSSDEDADPFCLRHWTDVVGGQLQQGSRVHGSQVQCITPAFDKSQDVLNQGQEVVSGGQHCLEVGSLSLGKGAFCLLQEQLTVAPDAVQRGLQLVSHHRE